MVESSAIDILPILDESTLVSFTGTIRARRCRNHNTYFDLELETITMSTSVVQLVAVNDNNIGEVLCHVRVGSIIQCKGYPKTDTYSGLSIYLESVYLIRCAARLDAIKSLLLASFFSTAQLCSALLCNSDEITELQLLASGGSTTERQLKKTISKHTRKMLGNPLKRCRQRDHRVSKSDQEVLNLLEQSTVLWPLNEFISQKEQIVDNNAVSLNASGNIEIQTLNETRTDALLQSNLLLNIPGSLDTVSARGSMTRGEYMHGRKQPQIKWFVDRMEKMSEFQHVLDIGGGRGDLAVLIAQTFPCIRVTMIDANSKSLIQAKAYALQCGVKVYNRMRFICARFTSDFDFNADSDNSVLTSGSSSDNDNAIISMDDHQSSDNSFVVANECDSTTAIAKNTTIDDQYSNICKSDRNNSKTCNSYSNNCSDTIKYPEIDFVVALHACGGLSDVALDFAAKHCCQLLVCPCCYLKNPYISKTTTATDTINLVTHIGTQGPETAVDEAVNNNTAHTSTSTTVDNSDNLYTTIKSNSDGIMQNNEEKTRLQVLHRLAESDNRQYSLRASRVINSIRISRIQQQYILTDISDIENTNYSQQRMRWLEKSDCYIANNTTSISRKKPGWKFNLESFAEEFSLRNYVLSVERI